jgi:signal transduction histidine kinase
LRFRSGFGRADILEKSWTTVRLQKRFQDKIRKIQMRLDIRGPIPTTAIIDAGRASQILTNLVRLARARAGAGWDR